MCSQNKIERKGTKKNTYAFMRFLRLFSGLCCITWDVTKVSVDAEVGVRRDDATLKDLLANDGGKGVFGCMDVGLDQPRVLWTFGGTGGKDPQDIPHIVLPLSFFVVLLPSGR